jgi:protease-4
MGNVALAWAPSEAFGVGASLRWYGAPEPFVAGATTVDLAATWRPDERLAIAFVARDVNGRLDLGSSNVPPSFVLAVGFRPLGTRELFFDAAAMVDVDGRIGARLVGAAEVPFVGRLFGSVEVERFEDETDLLFLGGISVDWGGVGVGGGVVGGDGFGDSPGWFVTGHIEAFGRTGLPMPRYVLDVDVSGVGARGIVSIVRRLDRALHDPRVAGVLLRMRDSGFGSAYAQELRMMVSALERAGKHVVCHLESASGAELYACAGATRTLVDPAGGAWLVGPSSTTILVGDLARELGINVESVRIGQYKSAPEQYENRRSTEAARAAHETLYDDVYARNVRDLARDWDRSETAVRRIIDEGPYVASELASQGLVDGRADENDLEDELRTAFGGGFQRREDEPDVATPRWGSRRHIGVVVIDGDVVTGENVDIPILGIRMSGSQTVVATIQRLARDSSVAAIILRIDSPGGSVVAADQIYRAVMRARRHKPVIASMGAIATSAAYQIASAADEIWADPATITGSIGVFYVKVDFADLAERIGVGLEHIARGRRAGLDSLFRPFTADERALAADKVRIWYRMFLERVHQSRGIDVEDLDAIARGRIWSGDAASRNGLVDHLGGFGSALVRARELGRLPDDAPIEVVPERPTTLLDYILGVGTLGTARAEDDEARGDGEMPVLLTRELREAAQLAAMLGHSPEGMPVARLEEVMALP